MGQVYNLTIRLPEEEVAVEFLRKKLASYERELSEVDWFEVGDGVSEQELKLYCVVERAEQTGLFYKTKILQSLLEHRKVDPDIDLSDEKYGSTNPDIFGKAFDGVRKDVENAMGVVESGGIKVKEKVAASR